MQFLLRKKKEEVSLWLKDLPAANLDIALRVVGRRTVRRSCFAFATCVCVVQLSDTPDYYCYYCCIDYQTPDYYCYYYTTHQTTTAPE